MTNTEIIYKATAAYLGLDEDAAAALMLSGKFPAFHTYEAWRESGYQVQRGEKAAFSARIWKSVDKKTDDGQKVKIMIMKTAHFFSREQVKPIQSAQ